MRPPLPLLGLFLALLHTAAFSQKSEALPEPVDAAEATILSEDLVRHLGYFASDEMRGRMATSDEAQKAAQYIEDHMRKHGLQPAGATKDSYIHKFPVLNEIAWNVCGLLPGKDPSKRREIVVIGAHYDHVGIGAMGSRTPEARGQVHNGADDNASGSSALLELIEAYAKEPPARSLLFIAFSAEELGLVGSKAWVKRPTVKLAQVTAMVNLDMIGRSRDRYLFVGGINTVQGGFEKLVRSLSDPFQFQLELHGGGQGPSDFSPFHDEGVPVLFLFTNEHREYHTPEDDIALIEPEAHLRVVRYAYRLTKALANGPKLKYTEAKEQAMPASSSRGLDLIKRFLGVTLAREGQGSLFIKDLEREGIAKDLGLKPGDELLKCGNLELKHPLDLQSALAVLRPKATGTLDVRRDGRVKRFKLQR